MKVHPFEYLPQHWRDWIELWSLERTDGKSTEPPLECFDSSVRLVFPDGSFVLFEYAFYAVDEERQELAVFTEHCGCHVFPAQELQYSCRIWTESPADPADDDEDYDDDDEYDDDDLEDDEEYDDDDPEDDELDDD